MNHLVTYNHNFTSFTHALFAFASLFNTRHFSQYLQGFIWESCVDCLIGIILPHIINPPVQKLIGQKIILLAVISFTAATSY